MKTRLPNIAIWARSGAGKSFATKYLEDRYGYETCKPGAICREVTLRLFGEDSKTTLNKVNDALRQIEPNIWLRLGFEALSRKDGVLIDGIRFVSNVEFCRQNGFRMVKIVAEEATRLARLAARGQAFDVKVDGEHSGETEIENESFDHTVHNERDDPDALFRQLDAIVDGSAVG
jgi:dephospho-CoA kinase